MKYHIEQVQPRPWPSGGSRTIAILSLSPEQASEQWQIVFNSGIDDLDEYEEAAIQLPSGRVAMFVRYRGDANNAVSLEIDSADDVEVARKELYEALGVSPKLIQWEGDALS